VVPSLWVPFDLGMNLVLLLKTVGQLEALVVDFHWWNMVFQEAFVILVKTSGALILV
jgi:hypothetical protein